MGADCEVKGIDLFLKKENIIPYLRKVVEKHYCVQWQYKGERASSTHAPGSASCRPK